MTNYNENHFLVEIPTGQIIDKSYDLRSFLTMVARHDIARRGAFVGPFWAEVTSMCDEDQEVFVKTTKGLFDFGDDYSCENEESLAEFFPELAHEISVEQTS